MTQGAQEGGLECCRTMRVPVEHQGPGKFFPPQQSQVRMAGMFLAQALTLSLSLVSSPSSAQDAVVWTPFHDLRVEGQAFADLRHPFDRLPERAHGIVRDRVWELSEQSAGICARFVTDAQSIRCRWGLRSATLAMPHMPATAVSGVDLFVRDEEGTWRWLACPRPTAQEMEVTLISGMLPGEREYLLYLPLYNGVEHCEISVPEGAKLEPGPPRTEEHAKPILFYGTSITHGACASRPGSCHAALVGRWFDRPVLNFGFSGNGRMEETVGRFLAELDPAVFVIDCLPNMNGAQVAERVEPLVKQLRKARPNTPIVLVEDRSFANTFLLPNRQRHHEASRRALRAGYERLLEAGVSHLSYVEGADLLGNEETVDGSHPSDLGFVHQAEVLSSALEPLLGPWRRP